MTLEIEVDRVECPLKAAVFILANSNNFFFYPNAVELTIFLNGFLKRNKSSAFLSRLFSVSSKYLLRFLTTHNF